MPSTKPATKEELAAARKYLEHDYAGHHLKGKPAQEANRHAAEIDDRYERARDIALTATDKEFGQLPKQLLSHQRTARKQAGITPQHAARIRSQYRAPARGRPQPRPPAPHPTRPRPPKPVRAVRQVVQQAAAPTVETTTDWSQFTVRMLGWGLALSLLYLVLTSTEKGGNPLGKLFTGASTAVRGLVSSTVDPLNHNPVVPVPAAPAHPATPAPASRTAQPPKASPPTNAGHGAVP